MKNKALKNFKELPKNFIEWISQLSGVPSLYNSIDAKKVYRENLEKEVGFIYKTFLPNSVNVSGNYYDNEDFIPQVRVEATSFGGPQLFFGSKQEYKELLKKLIVCKNVNNPNFNNFYQFGNVYNFLEDSIVNPIDII